MDWDNDDACYGNRQENDGSIENDTQPSDHIWSYDRDDSNTLPDEDGSSRHLQ